MIKALFFDMDGTLVRYDKNGEGKIPDAVCREVGRLREAGVKVFAATGRSRIEMDNLDFLRSVEFDAVASLNGQYCYTPKEDLLIESIPVSDLEGYMVFNKKRDFPAVFVEKNDIYINYYTEEFAAAVAKIGTELPYARDIDDLPGREIIQIMPMGDDDMVKELMGYMPNSKATRWSVEFVDIIAKNGGKDVGIKTILEHFGIDPAEIMAFGDGENDYDMLKMAGTGVAMADGVEMLKEVADIVTDDISLVLRDI